MICNPIYAIDWKFLPKSVLLKYEPLLGEPIRWNMRKRKNPIFLPKPNQKWVVSLDLLKKKKRASVQFLFLKRGMVMGPPINVDKIVSCESNSWTSQIRALSPFWDAREVQVISSFNNVNQTRFWTQSKEYKKVVRESISRSEEMWAISPTYYAQENFGQRTQTSSCLKLASFGF